VDVDDDWWIGNRDLGTGIRGGTCDVDDDIELFILELLLFVLVEYNCIKLPVSLWWKLSSVKGDDTTEKFVNEEWGCWFGSIVNGWVNSCLLLRSVEFSGIGRLYRSRYCFCRRFIDDVQVPIVDL
jgi:hypothetical protein